MDDQLRFRTFVMNLLANAAADNRALAGPRLPYVDSTLNADLNTMKMSQLAAANNNSVPIKGLFGGGPTEPFSWGPASGNPSRGMPSQYGAPGSRMEPGGTGDGPMPNPQGGGLPYGAYPGMADRDLMYRLHQLIIQRRRQGW